MNAMRRYIRVVDGFNYGLGRIMMYGIFVLMGILLWSSYNKTFASPQILAGLMLCRWARTCGWTCSMPN